MSVAGQWDFTIKNGQLLMKLNTSGGNFEAREESFMQPSLHLSRSTILLFESGNYKFALNFNAIGDIDGDTPTDIQNAYDLITTLIANFNLGGATPSLFQVLGVSDRPLNILEGASDPYTFQTTDAQKYILQTQELDLIIPPDVIAENGMIILKNLSLSTREILADTGVTLLGMSPMVPSNGLAIIKQIALNAFDVSVISASTTTPNLEQVLNSGDRPIKVVDLVDNDYTLQAEDIGKYLYVTYPYLTPSRKIILPAMGDIQENGEIVIFNNTGMDPLIIDAETNFNNGFGGSFNKLRINYKAILKYGLYDSGIQGWNISYETDGQTPAEGVITPIIKITDKSQQAFTDLASARTWIETFTSATKTNEAFVDGVYAFSTLVGSDFSLAENFCSSDASTANIQVEDYYGIIGILGNKAFYGNVMNNVLMGNLNFGNKTFQNANPEIKNVLNRLDSCNSDFASNYNGRMDVNFFGTTGGVDLPTDIFTTANLCWIRTPYSNKFNNGGATDGDLLNALANMTNFDKQVIYD